MHCVNHANITDAHDASLIIPRSPQASGACAASVSAAKVGAAFRGSTAYLQVLWHLSIHDKALSRGHLQPPACTRMLPEKAEETY